MFVKNLKKRSNPVNYHKLEVYSTRVSHLNYVKFELKFQIWEKMTKYFLPQDVNTLQNLDAWKPNGILLIDKTYIPT